MDFSNLLPFPILPRVLIISFTLSTLALIFNGCAPYYTAQSPETLPRGQVERGISLTYYALKPQGLHPGISLINRFGIHDRLELGASWLSILPGFSFITIDLKYGLITFPYWLSGDIGLSWPPVALHSMLLFGDRYLHGGIKLHRYAQHLSVFYPSWPLLNIVPQPLVTSDNPQIIPGILIGSTLGRREVKVRPELSIYFDLENKKSYMVLNVCILRRGQAQRYNR